MTYAQLVDKLAAIGVSKTEPNIRNKLARGGIHSGFSYPMSDSDRRPTLRFGGVTAYVIITAIVCAAVFLYSIYRHENEHKKAAHVDAEQAIATCGGGIETVPDMPCVIEALKIQSEQQYAAADLKAQQEMATWAHLMFIVTGAGVIFIAQTLDATRAAVREAKDATKAAQDAVDVTREIGEAQVRAYLTVAHAMIRFEDRTPRLFLTIRNAGQSPARNIRISIGIDYGRITAANNVSFETSIPIMPGDSPKYPLRLFNQRYSLSFKKKLGTAPADAKRDRRIRVFGAIMFNDVFTDDDFPVSFSLDAFLDGPGRLDHPIQLDRAPIRANQKR